MSAIRTRGLCKHYTRSFLRGRIPALTDLDLEVEEGEVFGYLGSNGAGKTTTLKLLVGLVFPTRGEAWIEGRSIRDPRARKLLGYLPELPYFYEYLSARELLHYYGKLFGLRRAERRRRVDELLEKVGLVGAADRALRTYSKGMRQRLGLAQALVNDPRVVILDEPLSGLDPLGRAQLKDLIKELRREGKTVLFSSHILSDVEALCDRVGFLRRGRLTEIVEPGRLLVEAPDKGMEVTVRDLAPEELSQVKEAGWPVLELGTTRRITVPSQEEASRFLKQVLQAGTGRLVEARRRAESLEEYFLRTEGEVRA